MLDFPNAPTVGQTFAPAGTGAIYRWDGTLWTASGQTSGGPNMGDFCGTSTASVGTTLATITALTIVSGNAGVWWNSSNGRYTPPPGRYHIYASFAAGATGGSTTLLAQLRKNGTVITGGVGEDTTGGVSFAGSAKIGITVDANGSDWFDLQLQSINFATAASQTWVVFGAFPITVQPGPSSSPGWRSLGTVNVGVAQPAVEFKDLPSDINFLECMFDLLPVTDNVNLGFQMFDASGVLDTTNGRYPWASVINYSSHTSATYSNLIAANSAMNGSNIITLSYPPSGGAVGNTAQGGISGTIRMFNIKNTTRGKQMTWHSSHVAQNLSYGLVINGSGSRNIAGAVTGFRLVFGAGNVNVGSIAELWGSP